MGNESGRPDLMNAPVDMEAPIAFECPRCGQRTEARFFGPCPDCSAALGDRYRSEQREVEVPEYVPKMNVTPNAVALKE